MFTGFRTKPNFFCFGLMRPLSGLFAFLILILAEVHNSAYGRLLIGCNLDQIQAGIARSIEGFVGGDDSVLSSIGTDDSDRRDADLIVDPRLNAFDCCGPFDLNKWTPPADVPDRMWDELPNRLRTGQTT
jgi:hypothetical protein